jgi:hypothetical protein
MVQECFGTDESGTADRGAQALDNRNQFLPAWMLGVVIALILIGISTQGRFAPNNPALREYFAVQPTPGGLAPDFTLPELDLGQLPPGLQEAARDVWQRLGATRISRPVEPTAQSARLRVEISELRQEQDGLLVRGSVTNISGAALEVPISAFELRDSTGASYIAGGGASAELQAGASTPLELTVPLPEARGLMLITNLPPDPPLEQRLLVADVGA